MGISAAIAAVGALTAYRSKQSADQQKSAQKKAEQAATQQEQAAQREFNRANRKQPDIASLLAGNRDSSGGGVGSTMLTGPSGVDAGALSLGKSTLLGQ